MKEKKVAWKVVTKDRRSFLLDPDSEYSLLYAKDSKVTAPENSAGVFCFETRASAEDFAQKQFHLGLGRKYKIIRVEPIGKGIYPVWVSRFTDDEALNTFCALRVVDKLHSTTGSAGTDSTGFGSYLELMPGLSVFNYYDSSVRKAYSLVCHIPPIGTICYRSVKVLD